MTKDNLILVHSFPTNSILLQGLIDYLNDYFHVHFVDLPGFTKAVAPLPKITMDGFYRFFAERVAELNLDSYVVGGISFGFMVVNSVKYDHRCRGILAIAPYMGPQSLRMSLPKKIAYGLFVKGVPALNASEAMWGSKLLREYLPKLRHYPPGAMDVMLEQIDARTFFETGSLLLNDRTEPVFQDLPYVLIANPDDHSVVYGYIHRLMSANVKRLLVCNTPLEHYPQTTTKEYFRAQVPETEVQRILDFLGC